MTEVADQFTDEQAGEVTHITHWIDGKHVEGASGRSGPVYNPATGAQSGEVDFASVEEVDAAVQAAKQAFASWRTMSLSRRTELFFRIRELFHDHSDDLARLLTLEHGKVFSDGLSTNTFPQAIALAHIHSGTMAGKLNGVIPPTTPSGWRIE